MAQSGAVSYYAVDGLGSVSLVSDAAGSVQNSYIYDAWGVDRYASETISQPFRYTSREVGDVAGQWFYRARFYRPGVGRFVSEDPIGFLGGMSLFAYVNGNPILFTDPTGLRVKNRSKHAIWIKREDSEDIVKLNPEDVWDYPQDAIIDPCYQPKKVYKLPDGVSADVQPNSWVKPTSGLWILGALDGWGEKDEKWHKDLKREGDDGWDRAFNISQPENCSCKKKK